MNGHLPLKYRPLSNTNINPSIPKTEEYYLSKLFYLCSDPLCIAGFDGYFKKLNPAFLKLLGYSKAELIEQPYINLIHPDDVELTKAEAAKLADLSIQTVGFVNRYRKKDGAYVYLQWNTIPDREEKLLYCSIKNVTKELKGNRDKEQAIDDLNLIIDAINAGIWIWNIEEGNSWWSEDLFTMLGLASAKHTASYSKFLQLLHPQDKARFNELLEKHFTSRSPYKMEVRLDIKGKGYKWVEFSGMSVWDEEDKPTRMMGSIIDIHHRKELELTLAHKEFILSEAGKLAKVGGWEVDIHTNAVYWSEEVYEIHEVEPSYEPDVESAISFFHADSIPIISKAVEEAIQHGKEYDLELKFITAKGKQIWVRAIGRPGFNEKGEVTSLRGVFQNISGRKRRELQNTQSLEVISQQNERLLSFAHIVSHNLLSHVSNFGNLIHLYNKMNEADIKQKTFEQIEISFLRLKETIFFLTEIVQIQTDIDKKIGVFSLQEETDKVLDILKSEIENHHVVVYKDFSIFNEVQHVGAYLQSILLNLISNAIKYRHPNRNPEIHILTKKQGEQKVLEITDNGKGIDLARYGKKLFGMYKTFHGNQDARGIGLFLVKNQIEAMGGKIEVYSQVNQGTTFNIYFR